MMLPNKYEPLDQRIVGKWGSVIAGTDINNLKPVDGASQMEFWLFEDGSARWGYPNNPDSFKVDDPQSPFRTEWQILSERTLTILIPVAPMPEYGIDEWQHDGSTLFDILLLEGDKLLISDRPFDGETITLLNRIE